MLFKFQWQWLNSEEISTRKYLNEWVLFDDKTQKILTDSFENNLTQVN